MTRRMSFDGFEELIRKPLAHADPRSYERVVQTIEKGPLPHAAPFALLLARLTGKRFSPADARIHWERLLALKEEMEHKLGWVVDIQTAAVEYISLRERSGGSSPVRPKPRDTRRNLPATRHDSPDSPDYYLSRLKNEMQRSKRYSHALSAILLDVADGFRDTHEEIIDSSVAILAAIIEKTVRTVDIVVACGPTRFLIILPDTNRREAQELAERITANVRQRSSRTAAFSPDFVPSASVAQWADGHTASGFMRILEGELRQRTAGSS